MKTAAIIIIGNEILSGSVIDTNSAYLATELRALGVYLKQILIIPDEIDVIARAVAEASVKYDYIFTSGGVGPTHDDMTMEAIAKGFGVGTVVNQRLAEVIKSKCRGEANDSAMRMAHIPEGAELIENESMGFPSVMLKNVYIFPGIPEFLVKKFSSIKERFRSKPFAVRKIFINEEECYIAERLEKVVDEFKDVLIGSYPKVGLPEYKVMVTLESTEEGTLNRAYDMLIGLLPAGLVVRTE